MRSNGILNINNSIFKTVINNNAINNLNLINSSKNIEELNNIYSLFNVHIYIATDYIQHSNARGIHKKYHIKELLLLTDTPEPLLKREDLMLLSERLGDAQKIIIGSESIRSSWSFIKNADYIIPGIPEYSLSTKNRDNICILYNNQSSSKKICDILFQKFPELKIISTFDNYNSLMEILNSYKVCVNLNSCIDSLYSLYAGCSVISDIKAYDYEQTYENVDHIIELISQELSNFKIKHKIDIHNNLMQKYNNETFINNISNLISKYIKEPFFI
jgi:hypothetical protein